MKSLKFRYLYTGLVFLVIYFIGRISNLTTLPVFGDEAIYIRWAQLIKNVDTLRFVPLTDGKQPLFMWINSITLRLFSDPLLSGRIISVIAGAGILLTLYMFCLYFFNYSTSIYVSFLYLFVPFGFFFDRLALADNLLSFLGLLSMFLSILNGKYPRLDLSLIIGMVLGIAWITKSPAVYFIILNFITFIVLNKKNLTKIYLPVISFLIALVIYNILRLGPQFHQLALRNLDYIWTVPELMKHPFDPLYPHLIDIFNIYRYFITIPIMAIFLILIPSSFSLIKNPTILSIFLWFIIPLLGNATIAKVFTARYILFTFPPLLILISLIFSQFLNHFRLIPIIKYILISILFIPGILTIYRLSTNPYKEQLPSTETGYTQDWTSGWGIKEVANYLISKSATANVIIGTEGYFGTLPDGLQIYVDQKPQITVIGFGLNLSEIPPPLVDARNHGDSVYLLVNQSRHHLSSISIDKMELINRFSKPDNDTLDFYSLK